MSMPTVIVINYDVRKHNLQSQQQAPPDVLTVLKILRSVPRTRSSVCARLCDHEQRNRTDSHTQSVHTAV